MNEAKKETQRLCRSCGGKADHFCGTLPVLDPNLTVLEHNQRTWEAYQRTMKREHRKSDLLGIASGLTGLTILVALGLVLARGCR